MRAAFYECDITPPLGGYLRGQGVPHFALDVQDRLYAKAIVVEDEGRYAAIVCADCISLPEDIHDFVVARVGEYTPIPAESICVCCNHTHWGAPVLGDAVGDADKNYTDVFYRLVADAIILAYKRLEDVTVTFGVGKAEGLSFSRNHVLKDGKVMTWGQRREDLAGCFGTSDPDVGVMTFYRGNEPIGALINFACHQATLPSAPDAAVYTGDFSSVLSKELKEKYGNGFVSLFLQGACGDLNHIDPFFMGRYDGEHYRAMGRRLAEETIRTAEAARPLPGYGVAACKERFSLPTREINEEIFRKSAKQYLEGNNSVMRLNNLVQYYANPKPPYAEFILQTLRIGGICIYIMPGEPYVRFQLDLKERNAYGGCMVVELSNGTSGYIATPDCWGPNCDIFEASFAPETYLAPEAGDRMVERLLEMADKLEK